MRKHTKVYLDATRLDPHEIVCEVCRKQAQDIHHIKARGMGGSANLDYAENLMALCRICHNKYGDKRQYISFLKEIHITYLKVKGYEVRRIK